MVCETEVGVSFSETALTLRILTARLSVPSVAMCLERSLLTRSMFFTL